MSLIKGVKRKLLSGSLHILIACDLVQISLGFRLGALLGPAHHFLSLNGTLIEDILVATLLGIIFCGYLV